MADFVSLEHQTAMRVPRLFVAMAETWLQRLVMQIGMAHQDGSDSVVLPIPLYADTKMLAQVPSILEIGPKEIQNRAIMMRWGLERYLEYINTLPTQPPIPDGLIFSSVSLVVTLTLIQTWFRMDLQTAIVEMSRKAQDSAIDFLVLEGYRRLNAVAQNAVRPAKAA